MAERDDLLKGRQVSHGKWLDRADTSQALQRLMQATPNWDKLADSSKEALIMIQIKVSRILHGNEFEVDHWRDISGYAELARGITSGSE